MNTDHNGPAAREMSSIAYCNATPFNVPFIFFTKSIDRP